MSRLGQSIFTIAVIVISASLSHCKAGSMELSHFLSIYPEASKKLTARFAQAKGELVMTRREHGKQERVVNITFAVDHGFRKYMAYSDVLSSDPTVVGCSWEDGTYEIIRSRDGRNYSVTGFGAGKADRERFDEAFGAYFAAPYAVLGTPLGDILKQPTFRPIEAKMVSAGGKDCLQVTYELAELGRTDSVILDPECGWVIRRAESRLVRPEGTLQIETVIEYGSTEADIPPQQRVEISNPRSGAICEFKRFEFSPTPRGEFLMSHYGLPDLNNTGERASGMPSITFLLLTAAIPVLIIALLLRRLASRLRA